VTIENPKGRLPLLRIVRASESVGARAVFVYAIDQGAVPFYARYGFKSFPANN
jgi:hypothetical protein